MRQSDKMDKVDILTAKKLLPSRTQDSNKGTFGKVLTIAGSLNYQGAAYLTAVSSLKIGAGLVSLAAMETVINNISALTPNLTFFCLKDADKKSVASNAYEELKPVIEDYNVIALGPGLSELPAAREFVEETLKSLCTSSIPVVIDADALNAIAVLNIKRLPPNSIITPHPKELSRLLNTTTEQIQKDRIGYAKAASEKFRCLTILKGQNTVICTKNLDISINTSGDSSLAKAGSGDVLTGIIAGFIAQGLNCEDAAKLGAFIHGLSGEIAGEELTQYCVLAQDIIDAIPKAIKKIQGA